MLLSPSILCAWQLTVIWELDLAHPEGAGHWGRMGGL